MPQTTPVAPMTRLFPANDPKTSNIELLEALLAVPSAATSPSHALLEAIAAYARHHPERTILVRRQLDSVVLIKHGQQLDDVYVLIEGQLAVYGDGSRLLARLGAPALVGEIARQAGGATATVEVDLDGATVLVLSQADFEAVKSEIPGTSEHYRNLVTGRLIDQLADGGVVTPLIARGLLRLAGEVGASSPQQAILEKITEDILLTRPDILRWRRYGPGETLIVEGEPLDAVSIIVRGTALIRKAYRSDITIGPGTLLGEMSALSGRLPTATVVAGPEPIEVLHLSRLDFQHQVLTDARARVAVRELALHRLREQYEAERLDPGTEERLRIVRDQNTDALIRRQGLRVIAGNGVFRILNPHGGAIEIDGTHVEAVDQKYALLAAAEKMLKCGRSIAEVLEAAAYVRQQVESHKPRAADDVVQKAIVAFVEYAAHSDSMYSDQVMELKPAEHGAPHFALLVERIKRIRWLEQKLRKDPLIIEQQRLKERALGDHVRSVALAGDPIQALDDEFRTLMELGIRQGSEQLFGELSTVMFEKVPFEIHEFDTRALDPPAIDASDENPCAQNYGVLGELRLRLARGEASAIGGPAYPQQRFSKAVLDAVACGEIGVVVYDGDPDEAERYVRRQYTKDPLTGTVWHGLTTKIQGLDGSGPRTLLTVKKSRGATTQYLIIAGYGASRQLHNAGAILLHHDDEQRRVPEDRLELATQNYDYVGRSRDDVLRALAAQVAAWKDKEILRHTIRDVESLPIQLLILQNPLELLEAFGQDAVVLERSKDALFRFYTGFVLVGNQLVRLVVPKVGGDGLYGDTAGLFVSGVFTAGIARLLPHVIFNGTAGGFAYTAGTPEFEGARGLGEIKPGGIIIPLETIEQIDDGSGPARMRTLFCRRDDTPEAALARMLRDIGVVEPISVNFTSHHAAVAAPAVETYDYIEEKLLRSQKASVDVEGGQIWKAVGALGRGDVTFTPVYTHSDDPRSSEGNPADSLAAMGPWFEGIEIDVRKYDIIRALLHCSVSSLLTASPAQL